MKQFFTLSGLPLLLALVFPNHARAQGVGIGTTAPDPSAALEIKSTSQGLLLPRLLLRQRNQLGTGSFAAPVPGLVIYQTDNTPGLYAYDGTGWVRLGPDNLGNHTATQALNLQTNALTGNGASIGSTVGIGVRADGGLNIGQNTSFNLLLGYQAGRAITTGGQNILIGYQAGVATTTGGNNFFCGYRSGYNNSTGSVNIFNGVNSGAANTTGSYNLFTGYNSGASSTTGSFNVFSGFDSGTNNQTGDGNLFVGVSSGTSNVTGNNNTALGYSSGPSAGNLTNATAIGAGAVVSQDNSLVLGNNANVGIGTSAPSQKLDVAGNAVVSGSLGIGTTTPQAQLDVAGYLRVTGARTGFGIGTVPSVAYLKLTATMPTTVGSQVVVAHGLTDSKILGVQVLVDAGGGNTFPPGFADNGGLYYTYLSTGYIVLRPVAGTGNPSAAVLGKTARILLTYEP